MEIRKPIFIIGSGRSGTTILYSLMGTHPEVCWFSNLTARHFEHPNLAVFHRLLDAPVIGEPLKRRSVERKRFSIRPAEAESIYHGYCGFDSSRKMTRDELTVEAETKFKGIVEAHLKATGKPRFMNKRTANTQRIALIDEMFPDAYYVHIIRDGRAVANSFFRVPWWSKMDVWWLGGKVYTWEKMGKAPIELCALNWQRNVQELLQNKPLFGDRYIEVRYEDLVRDTRGVVGEIIRFCELGESVEFFDSLPESLPNMNYKWQEQLDDSQKTIMERAIGESLAELGYHS